MICSTSSARVHSMPAGSKHVVAQVLQEATGRRPSRWRGPAACSRSWSRSRACRARTPAGRPGTCRATSPERGVVARADELVLRPVADAALVAEELADGDGPRLLRELRHVALHGRVQVERAPLHELQQRDGRDGLGDRGQAVDRDRPWRARSSRGRPCRSRWTRPGSRSFTTATLRPGMPVRPHGRVDHGVDARGGRDVGGAGDDGAGGAGEGVCGGAVRAAPPSARPATPANPGPSASSAGTPR